MTVLGRSCGQMLPVEDMLPELRSRYGDAAVHAQLQSLYRHGEVVEDPRLWLSTALGGDFKYMPMCRVQRCVCGSSESALLCRFVFWNLLGLRQCLACGLVFVSPRLTHAAMRQIFNEYYFDYSQPEHWEWRRRPVFKDIMRLMRRCGCRSLFDVGAAYGHFVRFVQDAGIAAAGCDVTYQAVALGRMRLGVTLSHGAITELKMDSESVDCVVSLDTLYYAEDPAADLRAMRRLVKPGGHIILRLRNCRGAAARARQQGRKPVGRAVMPSEHLWGFTPATISHLLRLCELEPVLCEPAAYSWTPLSPLHAVIVWQNRLIAKPPLRSPVLTRSFNIMAQRPRTPFLY